MALTRKMLKAMAIDDEKIDQIIDAHTETVDALKKERDDFRDKAEQYDTVKKELDGLKNGKDWKAEHDAVKKAFDDYKKTVTEKETAAAKTKAVRAYFESKGIKGANLEIAMRGAKDEISAVELDGDKIKDAKALDDLIGGDYKALVVKEGTKGADPVNPPANSGSKKTREEIMAIKDPAERQKAIAQNLELFGYGSNRKE